MVAVDALHASSSNPGPGAGAEEKLSHQDLGLRVRMTLRELDDKLAVHVDYRGREDIGGALSNRTLRLLFRAEARYDVSDTVTVGAGRFLPDTPTFLVVDGARLDVERKAVSGGVFAGRRAISSSRDNLGGFLPALGAYGSWFGARGRLDGTVSWSEDRITLGGAELFEDVGGVSGQLRGHVVARDDLRFGGQLSAVQGATYALGPTWAEGTAEARAVGLFQGLGWMTYDVGKALQVDVDALHQAMQRWSTGTVDQTEENVRPRFTDVRLRVKVGPPEIGWLRPMVRYRIRPDRTELRAQIAGDVHELGVPGLYARGRVAFDDIRGEGQAQDAGFFDRTFGAADLGLRTGGLDASIGASYVQRGAKPVSSRTVAATESDDLMPFVLEADPLAAARVFYSGKRWFVGADVEKHLTEPEARVFVQVGLLTEVGW